MFVILNALGIFVADLFKSRTRLEAENVFLRHQLDIAGGTYAPLQAFKEIMPLYHFAIAGRKVIDTLRAVLPDPEAARTHAIDLATNIGKHTLEPPANAVRVIDEEGSILFRVPIRRSIKLGATIGPHDSLLWLPRPSA